MIVSPAGSAPEATENFGVPKDEAAVRATSTEPRTFTPGRGQVGATRYGPPEKSVVVSVTAWVAPGASVRLVWRPRTMSPAASEALSPSASSVISSVKGRLTPLPKLAAGKVKSPLRNAGS